jgi:hypothetical protein
MENFPTENLITLGELDSKISVDKEVPKQSLSERSKVREKKSKRTGSLKNLNSVNLD